MRRVLVTGAGGNASRNFIKSLRASGREYFIVGIDTNDFQLRANGLCDVSLVCPKISDANWLEWLQNLICCHKIQFINFQTHIEIQKANQYRVLDKYRFVPSVEVMRLCADKLLTARILKELAPTSFRYETWAIQRFLNEHHIAWIRARQGAGSKAALPVRSLGMADEWRHYWRIRDRETEFMISEFLPGKEYAWQSVWKDKKLICSMLRERIEYVFGSQMPSGQSSSPSVARSVHDAGISGIAHAAVLSVDPKPNGVYGVDMKCNAAGVPKVTEINAGRFYTTSDFAAAAGYNMVDAYVSLFYGEDIEPKIDCVKREQFWIRSMDREPVLL